MSGQAAADTPVARVTVAYDLTIAGAPAAEIGLDAKFNSQSYKVTSQGRTTGLIDLLVAMRFSGEATGAINAGDVRPASYVHDYSSRSKTRRVVLDYDGNGKPAVSANPPFDPSTSRVPLPESKLAGTIDPVSAFVVPVVPGSDPLGRKQCERVFGVIDGQVRVDMYMSYAGQAQAGSLRGSNYRGPTVRCRAAVRPVGGHKQNGFLVDLAYANDIEVWLAPAAGDHYLVPVRLTLPTPIGRAEMVAREVVDKPAGKSASLAQ